MVMSHFHSNFQVVHRIRYHKNNDPKLLDHINVYSNYDGPKSKLFTFDTYSPATKIATIRVLITVASIHNLVVYQMAVKIAILNGDLVEEIYTN